MIVAGFVVDGWWGLGMVAAVIAGGVLITRAFSVGADREETRAIVPPVGIRLWTRPPESPASTADPPRTASGRPVAPSTEGGDG
jgi:hypothetical protein